METPEEKKEGTPDDANILHLRTKDNRSVINTKLPHERVGKDAKLVVKSRTKPIGKVAPFAETRNNLASTDINSETSKRPNLIRVRSFALDPAKVWAEKKDDRRSHVSKATSIDHQNLLNIRNESS